MSVPTSSPLNHQHIVACLWDFDKTLSPGYMQGPIFKKFGINEIAFWKEVNSMAAYYAKQGVGTTTEMCYLNHFITYAKNSLMKGLSNAMLKELGAQVQLCAGLPEAFAKLKDYIAATYAARNIKLEHYILSTGIKPMIMGSAIAPYVDGVYACEYIEDIAQPNYLTQEMLPLQPETKEISQIGCVIDNTAKTRGIFELNKGCNKNPSIDVNSLIDASDRRIPIENMIYIADGPSDVPAFSIMRHYGGMSAAVYAPDNEKEFAQTDSLLQARRVNFVGPADYRETSSTFRWLKMHLAKICERIVAEEVESVKERVGGAPSIILPPAPTASHAKPISAQTELL